jgi:RNA polymerase sigma-70 factor, ECF subfamily
MRWSTIVYENVVMVAFVESQNDPFVTLMLKFQQGDDMAFDELVLALYGPLVRWIGREINDWHAAEDLAQETFLRVYRSREHYRPAASFKTWLYCIARNLVSNFRRDCSRRRELFGDDFRDDTDRNFCALSGFPEQRTNSPNEVAEQKELRTVVRHAICQLPRRQREVVVLSRFHGFKRSETARELNVSVAAIKGLLARANDQLRLHLNGFVQDERPSAIRYGPLLQRPLATSPHSLHEGNGVGEGFFWIHSHPLRYRASEGELRGHHTSN